MIVKKIIERIEEVKEQLNKVDSDDKNTIHSVEFYNRGYLFVEREFVQSLCCALTTKSYSFLEGMYDGLKREKKKLERNE